MVFSSIIFLFIFLPIFLACYFFSKSIKLKNLVLLVFSLLFYAYGEPIYLLLMCLSIIVNFYLTKIMDKKNSKGLFILSLIFNIGILFIFKYFDFFIGSINNVLNLNVKFLRLSLPIGISFYTFQILTYVIDVYKHKVKVQNNIINLGCYISAFPQLIAGPIVRYSDINEELNERKITSDNFASGIRRFIVGLAKKVIIANEMAYVADSILGYNLSSVGFVGVLIGSICFMLQIYFDFSGYSDMAIGLGKMLGFNYQENFNYPYIANSITDFWRRWHISLSTFFRDYVYIPLGGNRCSIIKNIFNLFIVWLLTGLWHGASWNFVLWGLYYFIILVLEKYVFKNILEKTPNIIKHIYALLFILFGWIIFYFTDLNTLADAFKSLFFVNGLGNINILFDLQIFKVSTIIIFIIAILCTTPLFKKIYNNDYLLLCLFILSIIFVVASSYNPFIYFRF